MSEMQAFNQFESTIWISSCFSSACTISIEGGKPLGQESKDDGRRALLRKQPSGISLRIESLFGGDLMVWNWRERLDSLSSL